MILWSVNLYFLSVGLSFKPHLKQFYAWLKNKSDDWKKSSASASRITLKRKFRMPLWHSNILMYSGTHMLLYTVKSQIESATLFKIWHFWWDYNRVRIIFEWGLYYLIWVHEHMSILECPRGIGNLLIFSVSACLIWSVSFTRVNSAFFSDFLGHHSKSRQVE